MRLIKFIIINHSSWDYLMNFYEQAMNWIDSTKFIKMHDCSWNSQYELHELNHEPN